MCYRKKIKEGYFNKVRNNKSELGSSSTHTEDCEYVYPIYKWYCFNPYIYWTKIKSSNNKPINIYTKSIEIVSV